MKDQQLSIVEVEDLTPPEPTTPAKKSRHVTIATNHLVKQREKAVSVRDKAAKEIEDLDHALAALGWPEE